MPFGVATGWQRQALPKPEILSYPLETNVIDSIVLSASGVTADSSGPYSGRRYLLAGTILSKVPADGGNKYERYASASGQAVAGILADTVEFADTSVASNEPAAMLRRNVSFVASKIVNYSTYQVPLKAALPSCEFL